MKSGPAPTQVARSKPRVAAPVVTKPKPAAPPAEPAAAAENVPNSSNVDVEGWLKKTFSFFCLNIAESLWILIFIFFVCLSDDGHSIYVRNLPFDTTPTQLEEVFKSFGAIKHEGIQVRSNKVCDIVIQSLPKKGPKHSFLTRCLCDSSAARFLFWFCGV